MIQYDSIRVHNPELRIPFQEYLHRGRYHTAIYHYGHWKRTNGYFVNKGVSKWEEGDLLRTFMKEVNPDDSWGGYPVTRLELCKDNVCIRSPKELLKHINNGIKCLPAHYIVMRVNESYICIKYKNQEWVMYFKKSRKGIKTDNLLRFEYRMVNASSVKENMGYIPCVENLCDTSVYHSLSSLFEERWLHLIDLMQIEDVSNEKGNLFQQALLYSKERDGFVDYKIVEKIIAGNAIRELYGKSWYQCFDPREPVGKRRLMCWRDNIEGTLKGFYEWRDEKGFDGIAGIKEKLVDMVLEK